MSRRGVLGAVMVVVGAGVLAGTVWWQSRPVAGQAASSAGVAEAEQAAPEGTPPSIIDEARYTLRMEDAGPPGVAEVIATRVMEGARPGTGGAALAGAVEDTLRALLAGGVADVERYFATYAIEPPSIFRSDPEFAASLLARSHAVLERARFDPEGVRVSDVFIDEPPTPGFGARTSERPEGRAFLRSLPWRHKRVAEVAIPAVLHGLDGTEFEATWRIRFTFNPEAGQWVLTQHRVEGIPMGVLAPAPPL